jgi:hypothetical protein
MRLMLLPASVQPFGIALLSVACLALHILSLLFHNQRCAQQVAYVIDVARGVVRAAVYVDEASSPGNRRTIGEQLLRDAPQNLIVQDLDGRIFKAYSPTRLCIQLPEWTNTR